MHHVQPTEMEYVDSIKDAFFKSIAQQVIITDAKYGEETVTMMSASERLENLEIAVRKKLFEILQENTHLRIKEEGDDKGNDNNKIADTIGIFWKSTLDLCHHLVHHALTSSSMSINRCDNMASCRRLPFLLLSDCLEGLPSLDDTKIFWSHYVEPVLVDILFGDKFWCQLTETNNRKKISLPSSHLPFLKVTNQFLKRLEYSSDNSVRVEWKGRILWALSKGFSIADKSAMKSWGNFHTTNATNFESREEFEKLKRANMASSTNSATSIVEYNIYEAFWSLQKDFANPTKIQVGEFINKLRLILAAMESATASASVVAPSGGYEELQMVASRTLCPKQAKYLTSSALLPSQMTDPSFRSSVLTQFLIVASHLGAESPPLKDALAGLLGRARKLLQNDNPHLHKILWESILENGREDDWRQWKKQKCLAKVFAPNSRRKKCLDLSTTTDDSSVVGDFINGSPKKKRRSLDHRSGNILDNEQETSDGLYSSSSYKFIDRNNLIMISKDLNKVIPTLEQHLESYVEALDPESGIEDDYHPKNNSLFTWRAMRLYAKHQLPLMSQCRKPADLEKITREWYRKLHGKDIPGEMPSSELSDDDSCKKSTTTRVDENDDDNNIVYSSNGDQEMKDDENQEGVRLSSKTNKDTDYNDDIENVEMEEIIDEKMDIVISEKHGHQRDVTKTNNQDINNYEGKGEKISTKIEKEDPSQVKEIVNIKPNTSVSTKYTSKESDQQKQYIKNPAATSKTKDSGKPDGDQGGSKGRKKNQGQEKTKSGRRSNDGGRNTQEGGSYDDGPPPRRSKNDETQQSYRGRSDGGPTPRSGGRNDDDYHGDSNRQKGRGERYNVDRSSGAGGRDNFRANSGGGGGGGGSERAGVVGRDDNRSGDRNGDRNRRNNDNSRSRGNGRRRR